MKFVTGEQIYHAQCILTARSRLKEIFPGSEIPYSEDDTAKAMGAHLARGACVKMQSNNGALTNFAKIPPKFGDEQ